MIYQEWQTGVSKNIVQAIDVFEVWCFD